MYACDALQSGEIVTGLQSVPVYKLPLLLSAPRKFSWENAFLDFSMADHDTEAAAAVEAKEAAMAAASAETALGNHTRDQTLNVLLAGGDFDSLKMQADLRWMLPVAV